MVQLGLDGTVLAVDERICEMTGLDPEEVVGRPADQLWAAGAGPDLARALGELTRSGAASFRARLRHAEGREGTGVTVHARLLHAPGAVPSAILHARRHEVEAAGRGTAGVPERGTRGGMRMLAQAVGRAAAGLGVEGRHASLVLLDVQGEGGSPAQAMDEVLRVLAPRVRASEVLAWVGPETLAWLLRDVAGASARAAAERLRRVLSDRGREAAVWTGTLLRGGRPGPVYPLATAWREVAGAAPADPGVCCRVVADLVRRGGLDDDQADVLALRLGLDGGPVLTLPAVAAMLGMTTAEARRLLGEAMDRLGRAHAEPGLIPA